MIVFNVPIILPLPTKYVSRNDRLKDGTNREVLSIESPMSFSHKIVND